jgi:hypothetical protein
MEDRIPELVGRVEPWARVRPRQHQVVPIDPDARIKREPIAEPDGVLRVRADLAARILA